MALNIATDRAFRTPAEVSALVAAVVAADASTQEMQWLEWKGPLPINKADGQFAIAKAILGFANRQPSRAATVCEGTAYMVVGAEPQSAPGVPTVVDLAALGQGIDRYLHGPRWSAQYVDHDGAQVLVVTVEAPSAGDPIHTLQKAYDKFDAGTIFHRGTAQSEPAGPKVIQMLGERLVAGVREPDLVLELTAVTAKPLRRLEASEESVGQWLKDREAYARANSGERPMKPASPPPRDPADLPPWQRFNVGASVPNLADLWDTRWAKPGDKEEYEKRLQTYLRLCKRRVLENAVRNMVAAKENAVRLSVANNTDDPIAGVELTARVPQVGLLVYTRPPSADAFPDLPRWPDEMEKMLGGARIMQPSAIAAFARPEDIIPAGSRPVSVEQLEDWFKITWNIGNVLADTTLPLDVYIPCGPGAPDEIEVQLSARSTSHRGVARASPTLQVSSDDPWQLADWLNPAAD
jgi:hypothetical protein